MFETFSSDVIVASKLADGKRPLKYVYVVLLQIMVAYRWELRTGGKREQLFVCLCLSPELLLKRHVMQAQRSLGQIQGSFDGPLTTTQQYLSASHFRENRLRIAQSTFGMLLPLQSSDLPNLEHRNSPHYP